VPNPHTATTDNLEQALALVHGRPFEDAHPRRYAWAEPLRQEISSAITDAAYELGHRRLMAGQWQAAERAIIIGITLEPGIERLWRLLILAAHESHSPVREQQAIDRLLVVTDQLGCDLEPETERMLSALKDPSAGFDDLKEAL